MLTLISSVKEENEQYISKKKYSILLYLICYSYKINLEITPNSSSSCFSLKNKIKGKEENTSSNSKSQSYIKTTSSIKIDEYKPQQKS